jgi:hypothetical protein
MTIDLDGGYREYREQVEAAADSVMERVEEDPVQYRDDPYAAIWDVVEWHELVIKGTAYHLFVLENHDEPLHDYEHYIEGKDDYREILQALAYKAFELDVSVEVFDRMGNT